MCAASRYHYRIYLILLPTVIIGNSNIVIGLWSREGVSNIVIGLWSREGVTGVYSGNESPAAGGDEWS